MPALSYSDDEIQATQDCAAALTRLATAMERSLAKSHLGSRSYQDDEPQFGCHPYALPDFLVLLSQTKRVLESLHGAEKAKSAKFLDVGCGIGTKVYLAGLYFESHGIENETSIAEVAREFVADLPSCRIFPSDALTFANYGDYDVIFFYRPLRSEPLQEQMEERIYTAAREGCILLPMYPICEPPAEHFAPVISQQVYVKTQDATLSQRLMAEFANG